MGDHMREGSRNAPSATMSAFDEVIPVQNVDRRGVRLLSPTLAVHVSDEDGDGVFVVSDAMSTVYGAGDTPAEAIDEYVDNLFEHFDWLDRHEAELGSGLKRELDTLRGHFIRER